MNTTTAVQGQYAAGNAYANNSPTSAPIRDGGFQMRLLETRKMIEEALAVMDRIEGSAGTGTPKDSRIAGVPAGPMNLSSIIDELRARTSELTQRLMMHENAF